MLEKNKNIVNAPALYARKVEEEDEVFTLPKVNLSFRHRLQSARQEKQMTQKDLAVVGVYCSYRSFTEVERQSFRHSGLRVWKGDSEPGSDLQDGEGFGCSFT